MRKILLSIFSIALLSLGFTSVSFASEGSSLPKKSISQLSTSELIEVSQELDISIEELQSLENLIDEGIKKIDMSLPNDSVQVSENLILRSFVTEETIPSPSYLKSQLSEVNATAATYQKRISHGLDFSNVWGTTIVSLRSYGVFEINGSTSYPVDAYGTYVASGWDITAKNAAKGSRAFNTFVRNNFKGKLKLGFDKINIPLSSFDRSSTIYCDANGKYSYSWR